MSAPNKAQSSPDTQKLALMETNFQLLPLILNNIPQAVFWKDRDLVYLGCNQAFAQDAGLDSPEQISGKTDFEMPWTDQADLYRSDDAQVIESGEARVNYEEPQTSPTGEINWLRTSKIPIRDENGEVVAVLGMYEDITETKQTERAMKQNEQLLNSFINNFPDGVWAKDVEGRFVLANDYIVEEIAGTEVIGKTVYDTMPKENADFVWASEKRLLETGEPVSVEEDVPHADGKIYKKITTKFPLYDTDGKISGVGGVLIDITERKQTEQMLRESEERYRNAIAAADAVPYFIDYKTESYLFIGEKIEDLTGIPVGEMSPTVLGEMIEETIMTGATSGTQREEAIQKTRAGKITEWKADYRLIDRGGRTRWLSDASVQVLDADGQAVGAVGILQDITERKLLDQKIQAAYERRGFQVQVSTQISQEISQASELNELINRVVTLIKERLGYYHTQLLRYDLTQNAIVLVSGYGKTGEQMLAKGHRMPMGVGLIGTAAATGQSVIRPNLEEDSDWQPNPLLPETRGEIAVPIKFGDEILGVLDVQSDSAGALTEDDQLLLEGLCGQIAIAMEQTRLRQEMTERLEEINRLYRSMSHEGWREFQTSTRLPEGFHYDQAGVRVLEAEANPQFFVAAPLTVPGGQDIGILSVEDDPRKPLSSEDRLFLEQVSEQVALALESARLFEQTQAALEAVRESEAQLNEALQIAKLGYWEYDFANDEFILTDNFYSIFHTTTEKMGGYRMSSADYAEKFVHPEDSAMVGAEIERSLAVTDLHFSTQLEHRILYQDGGIGHIAVNINIEKDEDGNILRWYGANQDITERKLAEEAVRQAQERAQTILETVTLPLVITRISDNLIVYANQPAADVTGMKIEEYINSPAPNFYANPEERDLFITELSANGFVNNMQVLLRRNEGTFWALLSARMFTYQGEPAILTTITDISDRIKAQETTAKRAAELATVAEVGTTISTILNPHEMLQTVVELTKERFGLYHAHIYMLSPDGKDLVLTVGAGEVGRKMVEKGWKISAAAEQSLVAKAARERQGVLVNDVVETPGFLPNPLLLETHAEMAIPLMAGGQVLGVLDIQSDQVGTFTEEDVSIQTTLASQIAVALQNAEAYARSQKQAEHEALINVISQRIQSTTNIENALQVAIRELGRALGAKRTSVQLGGRTDKK